MTDSCLMSYSTSRLTQSVAGLPGDIEKTGKEAQVGDPGRPGTEKSSVPRPWKGIRHLARPAKPGWRNDQLVGPDLLSTHCCIPRLAIAPARFWPRRVSLLMKGAWPEEGVPVSWQTISPSNRSFEEPRGERVNGWPFGPTNVVVGAPFPARGAGLGE